MMLPRFTTPKAGFRARLFFHAVVCGPDPSDCICRLKTSFMKPFDRSLLIQTVRRVLTNLTQKQQFHLRYTDFWQETVRVLVAPELQYPSTKLEEKLGQLCDPNNPDHGLALSFIGFFQELLTNGYIVPQPRKSAPD